MINKSEMSLNQLLSSIGSQSTEKLPTEKHLRENGEVFVHVNFSGGKLTVYTNGYFVYSSGSKSTVQRVSRCKNDILYEFLDDTKDVVTFETFSNQPFYVRLAIEGEKRLASDQSARNSGKVFSYELNDMESADLADNFDLASEQAELDAWQPVLSALRRGFNILTDRKLTVLQKYFCEDMTHLEIANELGCTKQAIGKTFRAAIKKLREYLT